MKATVEAAETQRARIAAGVFSDFEDGTRSKLGTEWQISTDQMMEGKSTGELSIGSGSGRAGRVLAVHGRIEQGSTWPWSGAMLMMSSRPMAPVDLRPLRDISFAIRSDAAVRLFVFAASHGRIPVVHEIPATVGWTAVTLPFSELGLDGSGIQAILISGTRSEYAIERATHSPGMVQRTEEQRGDFGELPRRHFSAGTRHRRNTDWAVRMP